MAFCARWNWGLLKKPESGASRAASVALGLGMLSVERIRGDGRQGAHHRAVRIEVVAHNSAIRAVASRFRLMAAAVRKAWMRMLSRPRRTARARPCQVFASP